MKRSQIRKSVVNFIKNCNLYHLLRKMRNMINYEFSVRCNGRKLKGLKIYSGRTTPSEPWMLQLIEVALREKKASFVDVGANVGQTLLAVKSIDPDCVYYGFEPNPACHTLLEELVRINSFKNCFCLPVGLYASDEIKVLSLYEDNITNPGGSIVDDYWAFNNIKPVRQIFVPVMKFQSATKSIPVNKIGVIKIDVEGAELEVLHCLRDRIVEDSPWIIIEILSAYSKENKLRVDRQAKIEAFLAEIAYQAFQIVTTEHGELGFVEPIMRFDPASDKDLCNYLFVPSSDVKSVQASKVGVRR